MTFIFMRRLLTLSLGAFGFSVANGAVNQPKTEDGLTVTADIDPYPGTTEMASRLAKTQQQNEQIRARILKIQDEMAAQFKDVVNFRIEAMAENSAQDKSPIGFVELAASLNDVELVRYVQPPMTEQSPRYPLFTGPIPIGTYSLKVRSVAGVLQHGWPYALLQGRWNVEKTFALKVDSAMSGKTARIVLRPGDLVPSLNLVRIEGSPP